MQRILMLPGWIHGAEFWRPLASVMPEQCAALAVDWHFVLDPDALAARLRAAPSPVLLVGWSLGAMAALRLAVAEPDHLAGLLLVGATARLPADPPSYAGVNMRRLRAMRLALKQDPRACLSAFLRLCGVPPDALSDATDAAMAQSRDCAGQGLDALMEWDLRSQVSEIGCPVQLVHGGADDVVPLQQAESLADALPRSELTVVQGSPHTPDRAVWASLRDLLVRGVAP